jgi:hypothetical protein
MLNEYDYRILHHMQRAIAGHYTSAQLARNTGIPLAEVQRRLAQLEDAGYVRRSTATPYPAFHLTEQGRVVPPSTSGPQASELQPRFFLRAAREPPIARDGVHAGVLPRMRNPHSPDQTEDQTDLRESVPVGLVKAGDICLAELTSYRNWESNRRGAQSYRREGERQDSPRRCR